MLWKRSIELSPQNDIQICIDTSCRVRCGRQPPRRKSAGEYDFVKQINNISSHEISDVQATS